MARSTLDELEAMAEKAREEYIAKTQAAIGKIKSEINNEMKKIIDEDAIQNYYGGYEPLYYNRQNQLPKSLAPYVESLQDDTGVTLSFGVDDRPPYGAGAMKHAKRGKSKRKTPPNEELIFENFMAGIHPNANPKGITGDPTTPVKDTVLESIDKYYNEKIEAVVQNALSKIK